MSSDPSLWSAMAGDPRRFLVSRWPLRCLGYLVSTIPVAVVTWFAVWPAILLPPAVVLTGLPVGAVERRRLRVLGPVRLGGPHGLPPAGLGPWLRLRVTEAATWREFGYALCLATVLPVLDILVLVLAVVCVLLLLGPLTLRWSHSLRLGTVVADSAAEAAIVAGAVGVPLTVLTVYALCGLAGAQAAFARWLLLPTEAELGRRLEEVARSRGRLVSAFDAERSRIERDLHDGAQQHLVLLSMALGLAERELARSGVDGSAARLVADAHEQGRLALAALRELIAGVHPRVLTDFGLAAAVGELAERCPLPVVADLRLEARLPEHVESTAYFVVSEALANAAKHAGATRITVTGSLVGGCLVVLVSDDGRGGADPGLGTGLRGLADRVAVLDGMLVVESPEGGPTTLRMEVPCPSA